MTTTITQPQTKTPALGVGIHHGIPFDQYLALPYAGSHDLGKIIEGSPAQFIYERKNPKEPTAAFKLGTAGHSRVLTPFHFAADYVLAEPCSAILKSGDRAGLACGAAPKTRIAGSWRCDKHANGSPRDSVGEILSTEDHGNISGAAAAIAVHPIAGRIVNQTDIADRELTIIFDDPKSGMRCKARIDLLCRRSSLIADLKFTTEPGGAKPETFKRSYYNLSYFRQAEFHLRAVAAVGLDIREFNFIACEIKPTHGISLRRASRADLDLGAAENDCALAQLAECQLCDKWYGYPISVEESNPPKWKFPQDE